MASERGMNYWTQTGLDASAALAAASPLSTDSFLVPSRTGRSGFGQLGNNLAVINERKWRFSHPVERRRYRKANILIKNCKHGIALKEGIAENNVKYNHKWSHLLEPMCRRVSLFREVWPFYWRSIRHRILLNEGKLKQRQGFGLKFFRWGTSCLQCGGETNSLQQTHKWDFV